MGLVDFVVMPFSDLITIYHGMVMLLPYMSKSALVFVLVFTLLDANRMQSGRMNTSARAWSCWKAVTRIARWFSFAMSLNSTRLTLKHARPWQSIFMEQGNPRAAYGQYLAIAEQYPENFEARRALAELAFAANNLDEFERHGTVAVEMSPEDPRVQAIDLGLKYRAAALDEDDPALQALVAPAEALLTTLPDSVILNNLLIDSYARNGALSQGADPYGCLDCAAPDNRQLYTRRLALLAQLQDLPEIETQLQEMVEQFPGDDEVYGMLLRYYVSQRKWMRQRLSCVKLPARRRRSRSVPEPDPVRGTDAGRGGGAGGDRTCDCGKPQTKPVQGHVGHAWIFRRVTGRGNRRDGSHPDCRRSGSPDNQAIKITLARMLVGTGNQVGARQLVEEVLAQNASNVDALKMQASWQLQADETDDAIANLRIALDTAPEDFR